MILDRIDFIPMQRDFHTRLLLIFLDRDHQIGFYMKELEGHEKKQDQYKSEYNKLINQMQIS